MARRQLLTDEERRLLLGVPRDPDALARHYTFTRSDQDLVAGRRGDANRLGFAVQLALLRHPGMALAQMDEPVDALVNWLATQLEHPGRRVRRVCRSAADDDRPRAHARCDAWTAAAGAADLPIMIEAAAQAAWGTDRGQPIAAGVVAALRAAEDHSACAGSDRARRHCRPRPRPQACRGRLARWRLGRADSPNSTACLPSIRRHGADAARMAQGTCRSRRRQTTSANCSTGCAAVRAIGLPADIAAHVHEDRCRQLVREGACRDAHQTRSLCRTPAARDPGGDLSSILRRG